MHFWADFGGITGNLQCSSQAHWKTLNGLPISDDVTFSLGVATDLHIYNLDTVPPTDVVWNDVATD